MNLAISGCARSACVNVNIALLTRMVLAQIALKVNGQDVSHDEKSYCFDYLKRDQVNFSLALCPNRPRGDFPFLV